MSNIYLVAISSTRSRVAGVYTNDGEAVKALLAFFRKYRGLSCCLRHGDTGRRESVAEVEARTRQASAA